MRQIITLAAVLVAWHSPAAAQDSAPALELKDCRISAGRGYPSMKARCGTFVRPLNPAEPDGETVDLFVAVVPALSLEPERDPFVPIAGGPGQSTVAFYASLASAFEKIRRNRDILLIDQRGTGESAPMVCDTDEEVLEGRLTREETVALTEECLAALPHDPRFFTTSVAVADLEALRNALGYERLNLYGISYGSRVAQHFVRQHPEATRSVIIDGVVAPQLALGPAIAVEAQVTLEEIFARCAEDEQCAAAFPNLPEEFAELKNRLASDPVSVSLPSPLTGQPTEITFSEDEMAGALRLLSYHPNSVALLPLLIQEAINENYAPLAAQFVMIAENMSESINIGMHNAVVCTEDAPYFADDDTQLSDLEATYIGPIIFDAMDAMCSVWPAGPIDDDFKAPVTTDLPVLLLSGEADPITPPEYAELAAVNLGNARHLVGQKQGHGMAPRGCMPDILGRFVASASVDDLQTECLDQLHAMPFFLDFAGPSP